MKVAFVSAAAAPYGEMMSVAHALNQRGHDAFFVVPRGSDDVERAARRIGTAPVRSVSYVSPGGGVAGLPILLASMMRAVARERPAVVVVDRDRGADASICAVRCARAVGAPIVAFDTGITSASFKARTRGDRKHDARAIGNRVVSAVFQGQRRDDVVFYSWKKTLALAALDMLPPNPWQNGENGAALHLMMSERALREARAEGARAEHAVVVGLPSLDVLHASRADAGGPRRGDPICVVALPQLHEHKLTTRERAHEIISRIIGAATSTGASVIGSLHPSMQREEYAYLESDRFKLAAAPLARILPSADVSVHAFPTTTIWSLLCGVGALYLDVFDQGYDMRGYPGSMIAHDAARLEDDVRDAIARADELAQAAAQDRSELPPFDGRCTERIVSAIERVVSGGSPR